MSARARHRHRRSRSSFGKKVAAAFAVLLGVIVAAAGGAAFWVYDVASSAPSISTLKPINSGESSEVFAADGSRLGYIQADILRERVPLKEIPRKLRQATIAIEDERFYQHSGVDYGAIIRAAVENVEAGEIREGASTITQQLVRNLYIEDPEDTLERKIIEAEMAREYENEYSKNEILEQYLNTASYGTNNGRTAVGVEAASQVFFNKHVSDLNLGEAALLAGLPQAPSQYNPFENPERAIQRRNLVLKAMRDQGKISDAKYEKWRERGLGLERGYRYETIRYQYFFDYVQQELIDRYGVNTVRLGGLKVHTTLEPKLQDAAQAAIDNYHTTPGAAAALVSIDADTGKIKAMASSAQYDDSQFNLAAQGLRQPGSAFKPFALTAAVDMGIDPDSTSYAAPSTITLDTGGTEPWTVSGGGSGSATLRTATAASINTVYAQLVLDIGPEAMNEMAKKLGITAELNNYPAEVLGALTYGVSVLDMASAYSTIANGGIRHKPTAINRVEFPDGEVDEPKDEGTRVISDGVAYTVADVMKGALQGGGTAPSANFGCPASGKTGTTEQQSDAWFVGYTPHVSTAVWVGNPDARVPMPGYGADLAAPIWRAYMEVAASEPCDDFPEPKNPADLAPHRSDYTNRASDYDDDSGESYDEDGTTETPEDADGDGEPDDAYAPGIQDEPDTGNGGNGNNGGNNGNGNRGTGGTGT